VISGSRRAALTAGLSRGDGARADAIEHPVHCRDDRLRLFDLDVVIRIGHELVLAHG